ncbi:hypothetical protein Leryth_004097 [Lithospermum erythrorhizon]|nr:hypothetical protein Leryth_004097 [Lithospermum erythrorhizon]
MSDPPKYAYPNPPQGDYKAPLPVVEPPQTVVAPPPAKRKKGWIDLWYLYNSMLLLLLRPVLL